MLVTLSPIYQKSRIQTFKVCGIVCSLSLEFKLICYHFRSLNFAVNQPNVLFYNGCLIQMKILLVAKFLPIAVKV